MRQTYADRLAELRRAGWNFGRKASVPAPDIRGGADDTSLSARASPVGRRALLAGVVGAAAGFTLAGEGRVSKPASAALPVFDSANLVKNAETALQAAKGVAEQIKTVTLLTDTKKIIGEGLEATGARELFDTVGAINDACGSVLGRLGGFKFSLPEFDFDLPEFRMPDLNSCMKLADAGKAIMAAAKIVGRDPTQLVDGAVGGLAGKLTDMRSLTRVRHQTYQDSRAGAFGVALHAQADVAGAAERIQKLGSLAKQASGSGGDLRSQQAVNTSVQLAILEELSSLRFLMARFIQMDSAGRAAGESLVYMPAGTNGMEKQPWQKGLQSDGTVFGGKS